MLTPEEAYKRAKESSGTPELRILACGEPVWAYWYAHDIDKHPRDDTRRSACKKPCYAFWYAFNVDKHPREDTRKSACEKPYYAYQYAKDVDKVSKYDTYQVVLDSNYQGDYESSLGIPEGFKSIKETLNSMRDKEFKKGFIIC